MMKKIIFVAVVDVDDENIALRNISHYNILAETVRADIRHQIRNISTYVHKVEVVYLPETLLNPR